jgi:hypothetical protein
MPGTCTSTRFATLALDAGLGGAESVDAATDGLDRGLDGRVHALGQPGVCGLEHNAVVAILADVESVGARTGPERSTNRLRQLAQVLIGLVEVGAWRIFTDTVRAATFWVRSV